MNTKNTLELLKKAGQDNEWYPTTDEIIQAIINHVQNTEYLKCDSMLDIGAGDGRVINQLCEHGKKLIIEISPILTDAQPKDCIPVGTDFFQTNIVPIRTDVIFCNPPYQVNGGWKTWTQKIILEGNAKRIYLVIPRRWKNDSDIKLALKRRRARAEVIGAYDFLKADRKARSIVDLVYIDLCAYRPEARDITGRKSNRYQNVDPFEIWIDETFKFDAPESKYNSGMQADKKSDDFDESLEKQLVAGKNQIEALVELYNRDLVNFKKLYDAISDIPYDQLKTLGASIDGIKESIRENLMGLKKKYWLELFNRYEPITSKLTTRSRNLLTEKFNDQFQVDFSLPNIYAITAWCCKNANEYIDDQLIDIYKLMTRQANIQMYKSNKKTFGKEEWRYGRKPEDLERYCLKLDYRLVIESYGKLFTKTDRTVDLDKYSHQFLNDLATVAQNLGFPKTQKSQSFDWGESSSNDFTWPDGTILMRAKAHNNGNLHLKINVDVLKAINIKFSQLMGWIKESKKAAEEMNISRNDAEKYFSISHSILPGDGIKLLTR